MRKLPLILFALSLILVSCTNNDGVNKAFVKYGHKNGVTSVSVPGFVIHLAAAIGDLSNEEKDLLRSIDKIKVLAVEDHHLNSEINLHNEFYSKINEDGDFEELLAITDKDENVTIFGKMGKNNVIKELIILVGGDDNALVYLKGNLKPNMLNKHFDLSDPNDFLSFNK